MSQGQGRQQPREACPTGESRKGRPGGTVDISERAVLNPPRFLRTISRHVDIPFWGPPHSGAFSLIYPGHAVEGGWMISICIIHWRPSVCIHPYRVYPSRLCFGNWDFICCLLPYNWREGFIAYNCTSNSSTTKVLKTLMSGGYFVWLI